MYLVTHFWHMPRSVAAFHAAGLEVVPAPMGFFGPKPSHRGVLAVLPRTEPLCFSGAALHEWVGRLWYRVRYGY